MNRASMAKQITEAPMKKMKSKDMMSKKGYMGGGMVKKTGYAMGGKVKGYKDGGCVMGKRGVRDTKMS